MVLLGRKIRSKELESVRVVMNGEEVIRSQMVKCLGVWIDDGLIWKGQRCFSGLARLRRLSGVFSSLKKMCWCYISHLDYCAVVWEECSRQLQLSVSGGSRVLERVVQGAPRKSRRRPQISRKRPLREEKSVTV